MKTLSLTFILFLTLASYGQLLKGDRTLAWQVDMSENGDFAMAFEHCKAACMESVHMSLTWSGLEPTSGEFDADIITNYLDVANLFYPLNDTKVELQLAVTNTTAKEVPADLMATDFDAPTMIARFKTALDTVFAHIPDVELAALNIGNETDILFGTDEAQYEAFASFLEEISEYARTTYYALYDKELKIGTTLTLEGLTSPAKSDLCQLLNAHTDIVSTTYYPLMPDFTMAAPAIVEEDFDALVAEYPNTEQPIYFAECGYASSSTCNSSDELQAQFYTNVFTNWDKHIANIKYLTIFKSTDWSEEAVEAFGVYYGIDDPIFLEYLRTLGVRTWEGDGTHKLAYEFILCELEARDWCAVECNLSNLTKTASKADIAIYPNPVINSMTVEVNHPVEKLLLFNAAGQMVRQSNTTTINLSTLKKGAYILEIQFKDGSIAKRKVIK